MRGDEFGHLEHRDFVLAEDGAEQVVGEDVALVRRVLEIVLLDIFPKFLDDFGARERARADNRFKLGGEIERLHESWIHCHKIR